MGKWIPCNSWDFNIPLSEMELTTRQKKSITKYKIWTYIKLSTSKIGYIFLTSAHGTFFCIDHILDHKISLKIKF